MKKILHTIYTSLLLVGLVAFALTSCVDDELVKSSEVVEGVPVTVTLTLSGTPAADVTIDTRADNSLFDITNLAIFVFHEDGTYEHYVSSRATDESYKVNVDKDLTTVDGGVLYKVRFKTTTGKKKLIAVANTSAAAGDGGFWELTAKQEDVVGGHLSFEDIKNEIINLRSALYENSDMQPIQIVSSSLMLLSGYNEGVVFGADGTVTSYGDDEDINNNVIVKMDRAMAKIKFKIVEKPKDDSGDDINATFRPSSYRVYNIPTKSYLTNKDKMQTEGLFASSSGTGSESETATKYIHYASSIVPSASEGFYSFEFYMPENIQATKNISDYNDRDKWNVETDGASTSTSGASPENKKWTNAPQNSTFVVISGTYSSTGADGKDYTGNVSYTIHLGDFSNATGSMGNFSIERNSSYTYTITVKGVDKIIAEAKKETDKEYQQGAEGQIFTYDASTYSYELDAHYEQVYLEYNLSQIAKAIESYQIDGSNLGKYDGNQSEDAINKAIANNLILVIQSEAMDYTETSDDYTVQNKRGTLKPYQIYADADADAGISVKDAKKKVLDGPGNTNDPLKGFDYKWIEFWPQSETYIAKYPGVPEWSRESLDDLSNKEFYGTNDETEIKEAAYYLMDVYDVIVAMGNVVKKIYKGESEQISISDRAEGIPDGVKADDIFTSGQGITIQLNQLKDYVARFTAFVNEYYYLRHPLTGERITTWSVFTNKINREMLIAMSSDISSDGNSTFSTVYSYISQLSIQTFYNSRILPMNGFGIETYNETPHIRFGGPKVTSGLSDSNGRSNQIELIGGLSPEKKWENFIIPKYNGWTTSIGADRTKHTLLVDVYNNAKETFSGSTDVGKGAYFACLSRNRDLNGNGIIDENEVRWYLPAVNEYIRIGIGSNAISNAAQLYMGDKSYMERSGYATSYIWDGALYFTSSDQDDKRVYWAVEKGSYGGDGFNYTGSWAAKPIRCIRALPATKDGHDISTAFVESDPSYIYHNNTSPKCIEFRNRLVDDLYRQRIDGSFKIHNEDSPANSFSQGIFVAEDFYYIEENGEKIYQTYTLGDIIGYYGTMTNPCANYSEEGYTNWRVPNLVELSAMNAAGLFKNIPQKYDYNQQKYVNLADVACCTQFSNQNVRYGFAFSSLVYCPGSDDSQISTKFLIRCVRDVPADFTFPTN